MYHCAAYAHDLIVLPIMLLPQPSCLCMITLSHELDYDHYHSSLKYNETASCCDDRVSFFMYVEDLCYDGNFFHDSAIHLVESATGMS